jgi:NADH-quinone oxidoreductase subunit L
VPEISVPESSRYSFMKTESADVEAGEDVPKEEVIYSETYTEAVHQAHVPAMLLSLLVALTGIFIAFLIYHWKKINPDKIASALKPLYKLSYNKWYFDEIYDKTFVAGTLAFSRLLGWFDLKVIDGIVDGSAAITKLFSKGSGLFDNYVVDGFVNLSAYISGVIGLGFRKLQTGKVQTYVVLVIFSLVILLFLFKTL